ncbi:MAG: ATP-binding protein, partial [Oleiphilaceae bacterium]|nr:ATP-binding protein [Oleiphilaceae bacterium]
IIRPIRKLGDQVRASIDDRDYETRLVSDYNDELSQLANWFNARTDQLSEVLTALQARNAELSEARVEAETANRAKNVFLASMSHEIRTPMNAIIGLADVLARTQLDEAQQTYVHTLHGSAQSLLSLVNDIMDFSKIEANKLDLECIAFDLRHTLDDCAELVAFQAHEKKLDFHYFVDPELDQHVMGDPNRLRQVILNLCTNAVKFTASGRVRLWLDKIAQTEELVSLRIIVEDTGIGMSDAARKRLFKPFSQGDSSTTRQYGGTGLGLAISKHLLELMGAELNFDSEEGRGSRFEVRLNLARSRAEHLRQEPLVRHVIAGVSCPVMHEILERYCTHMGCTFEGHADLDAWQRALASHAHKGIALCVRPEWLDHADVVRSAMTASEQERRPVLIMLHSPYDFNASRKLQVSRYFQLVSLGLPLKYEALRSVLLSPQDRMQTHHPVTRQANRELVHLQQKRVLVAEDNHVNQQVIMLLLKDLGLEADIVSDGEQALNAAQNKRYDLILMDWQMPQMDGLQAAREIRKGSADNQPIIVAVTANAMSGDVEACYAAGMNDYLSKPLRRDDLKRVLMQWLG